MQTTEALEDYVNCSFLMFCSPFLSKAFVWNQAIWVRSLLLYLEILYTKCTLYWSFSYCYEFHHELDLKLGSVEKDQQKIYANMIIMHEFSFVKHT